MAMDPISLIHEMHVQQWAFFCMAKPMLCVLFTFDLLSKKTCSIRKNEFIFVIEPQPLLEDKYPPS